MRKVTLKRKEKKDETNQGEPEMDQENSESVKSEESLTRDKFNGANSKGTPKKGSKKLKKHSQKAVEDVSDNKEEVEYEVEEIIDHKTIRGKVSYLIRWKGYGSDSDTWEPENTLSCPQLVEKYQEANNLKNAKQSPKRKTNNVVRSGNKKQKTNDTDDETEYEVDRIIDVYNKRNGERDFLIRWKGFGAAQDSWEPEANVNCPELVEKFMKKLSSVKNVDNKNLRDARQHTKRFTLTMNSTGRRISKRNNGKQRASYFEAE